MGIDRKIAAKFFLGLLAIWALHHAIPHTHVSHAVLHTSQNDHEHNHSSQHDHDHHDHDASTSGECINDHSADHPYTFHVHEFIQLYQKEYSLRQPLKIGPSFVDISLSNRLLITQHVLRPPPSNLYPSGSPLLHALSLRGPPQLV